MHFPFPNLALPHPHNNNHVLTDSQSACGRGEAEARRWALWSGGHDTAEVTVQPDLTCSVAAMTLNGVPHSLSSSDLHEGAPCSTTYDRGSSRI